MDVNNWTLTTGTHIPHKRYTTRTVFQIPFMSQSRSLLLGQTQCSQHTWVFAVLNNSQVQHLLLASHGHFTIRLRRKYNSKYSRHHRIIAQGNLRPLLAAIAREAGENAQISTNYSHVCTLFYDCQSWQFPADRRGGKKSLLTHHSLG